MTSKLVIGFGKISCLALAGCIALAGCRGCSTKPAGPDPSGTGSPAASPSPASTSQPASSSQPAVVNAGGGKDAKYDFGKVQAGSKHTVVFVVDNPTDQPLVFKTVRGECECVTADDPPKQIAAKSSARITVVYVAPKPAIEYESSLIILTTNPERKVISLHVKSSPP